MGVQSRVAVALTTAVATAAAGLALVGSPAAAAPENGVLVYGLTDGNVLVRFRADRPGTVTTVGAIAGITADLVGLDVRPATGELLAVGANSTLWVLDPATARATLQGSFTPALSGTAFGVDVNPVADRVRIVSDSGQNLNVAPNGGASVATQTLTYADRDDADPATDVDPRAAVTPDVRGVGYTGNVARAAATRLVAYDVAGGDALAELTPTPDDGELSTLGTVTTTTAAGTARTLDVPTSATGTVGLDVEAVTDDGLAALRDTDGTVHLYSYDTTALPAQGARRAVTLRDLGRLGSAAAGLEDLAIASARYTVDEGASVSEGGGAVVTVRRVGDNATAASVVVTPATTGGTAEAGDFTRTAVTARFAAGDSTTTVTVPTTEDAAVEVSETFSVTLSSPSSAAGNDALLADRDALVTIVDDDRATPTPTPSTTPPVGTAPPGALKLTLDVLDDTIRPGEAGTIVVNGTPGARIDLWAYSRPSTTYRLVREGTLGSNGTLAFSIFPGTNTRLYAAYDGQSQTASLSSLSAVQNVATGLSLTVIRNGSMDYTFQGRILPRRSGQLITLYRLTNGNEVITSQVRTDSTGTWAVRRLFVGQGVFPFIARSGLTLSNVPGASNLRPTAIYAGPQR